MTDGVKKRFLFARIGLFFFVVPVSLICLLCVAAGFISPGRFWGIALFSLIFHYVYPLNLISLIICLFRRKKLFILPFIPFVLGLHTLPAVFQFGMIGTERKDSDKQVIKVMSFNVRLFDLYNWSHSMQTRQDIFNVLAKEQPDILCLQEFYSSDREPMKNLDTLVKFLKSNNYHVEYPVTLHGIDHWGIATFSLFPVVNKGVMYFGRKNGNVCIYTDVVAYGDTLRIFNTHLESIRFRKEDYRFINNIENSDENAAFAGSKNILKRMRRAYIKRATEAERIDSAMGVSPYKHILCGDFNDPPASFTYAVVSKNMNDAFRESGAGFGETYNGPFPAYRIDYILHDKSIRSFNYKKINVKVSDHYPITSEIVLR